jgi:hypothetical protein
VATTVDKVTPVLPSLRSTCRWPLCDGHEPYRTWRTDVSVRPSPWQPCLSYPCCSWQTPSSHQLQYEQLWDQAQGNASHIQIEFKWFPRIGGRYLFVTSTGEGHSFLVQECHGMQSTWAVKGTYLTVSTVCNNPWGVVILITIVNCRNFVASRFKKAWNYSLQSTSDDLYTTLDIGPTNLPAMIWQGCVGYTVQLWDYKTLLTMITYIALHATNGVMWWWGSKWWSCRSLMDRSINAAQK